MSRLYRVTYIVDEENYESIVPEWGLPDIEDLVEVEFLGSLLDGYLVVEDSDGEDDPEKADVNLLLLSNT